MYGFILDYAFINQYWNWMRSVSFGSRKESSQRIDMKNKESILMEKEYPMQKNSNKPRKRNQKEQEYIEKAKQILMEQKDMTEPKAFRYLQKCSMDSGRTMVETAQMLILLQLDKELNEIEYL